MRNKKGILFTVSSAIIFGIAPIFATMSYAYGNTAFNMMFFRNCFSIIVFIFIIRKKGLSLNIGKDNFKKMLIISLFGSFITGICLYKAYTYIGVGTTTTIHFMYPFLVCIANSIFFKESFGKVKIFYLILCLFGVSFFVNLNDFENMKGVSIAFISAISYAFFMLYLEKQKLTEIHPCVFCFYLSSIISIVLIIINFFIPIIIVELSWETLILMIISSIGTSFVASVLFNMGVKEIGSSKAAIFSLFEPIASVAFGYIILKETVTFNSILGCVLLIIGIFGLSIYDMRKNQLEKLNKKYS